MSVVLDCSVALNWIMPDENDPRAAALLERVAVTGAVVPPLFRLEVGNALLLAVRRKRITEDFRSRAFAKLGNLPLEQDREGEQFTWTHCVDLAASHDLTLYDASYLEVSTRLRLPLATFDEHLAQAARRFGMPNPWTDV
ncbi:MAG: type II toxin-antitoxin system VapC family toxin [Rhizobiaceae bacterium]|nr:type II toxin-antitoxin system VapC family toxin [Rhizobiaceae bacterium]